MEKQCFQCNALNLKKNPVKQRISYTDMSHQTRESVVSHAGYITRIKNTGVKCISFCNGLNTVTNSLFYKHNQNFQQRIYLYIESGIWSNTLNFVLELSLYFALWIIILEKICSVEQLE